MKCSNKKYKIKNLFYPLLPSSSVTSRTTSAQSSCDEFLVFVNKWGTTTTSSKKKKTELVTIDGASNHRWSK